MRLKLTNIPLIGVKVCVATLLCAALFGGTQMSGGIVHADESQGAEKCTFKHQNGHICGSFLIRTGKTESVNGKIWYFKKCAYGHVTLSPNLLTY